MPDAPKPCYSFGHRLVGDSKPLCDRRVAHPNLLKLNRLRRDLLVDRRGVRVQNCRVNRDLREGSNSLRTCPLLLFQLPWRAFVHPNPYALSHLLSSPSGRCAGHADVLPPPLATLRCLPPARVCGSASMASDSRWRDLFGYRLDSFPVLYQAMRTQLANMGSQPAARSPECDKRERQ